MVNSVFIDTNKISTVFGRSELANYINRQIQNGDLVRIKNRATQTGESNALIARDYGKDSSNVEGAGKQAPTTVNNSISDSGQNVNTKYSLSDSQNNAKNLVESSSLVYLDTNKNRTKSWMQGVGLQLPADTSAFGSMGSITYQDGKVKIESVPFQKDGNTVIAPIYIDGYGFQNSIQIDSNAVTNIYGRKNAVTTLLTDAMQKHDSGTTAAFYLDVAKAAGLYQVQGVTMPNPPSSINGFLASITDRSSPVKPSKKATALLQRAKVPMPKAPATQNGGYIHSLTEINSPVKPKMTSIHLQVDTQTMLEYLPASATVYVNKNELDPVGATNNLRGLAAKIKFTSNVQRNSENVNTQNSLTPQSQQFKRWFRDWQNAPKKQAHCQQTGSNSPND